MATYRRDFTVRRGEAVVFLRAHVAPIYLHLLSSKLRELSAKHEVEVRSSARIIAGIEKWSFADDFLDSSYRDGCGGGYRGWIERSYSNPANIGCRFRVRHYLLEADVLALAIELDGKCDFCTRKLKRGYIAYHDECKRILATKPEILLCHLCGKDGAEAALTRLLRKEALTKKNALGVVS